jgi:hypothetical protein
LLRRRLVQEARNQQSQLTEFEKQWVLDALAD